jgi:hypothetical protein
MIRTVRVLGQVLESAHHEKRMIRTDPDHPDNVPYQRLNKLGELILRVTGDDRDESQG